MKPPLMKDDTCCLCGRLAAKVHMTIANYQGLSLPVAAALCAGCHDRKDRVELLQAYVEQIFLPGKLQ
jgi:hypothetical protein